MAEKILKIKSEKLSLSELYENYSVDIFRYSFSILKNEEEAKDAVQEVFVKYAENESSFKKNCSYKSWLLVLTRNFCFNRIKSSEYRNIRIEGHVLEKSYENDFELNMTIKDALKELSADENELIFLREYEGYSYKEIADLTKQSLENVKIKIYRARKKLREILR
jgi:RNA polymerase sigma-70 factor, ECF subfamily